MQIAARHLLLNDMSESQWQRQVTNLLDTLGYVWYHTKDSRLSNAGFPDLLMWHPDRPWRIICAELKRESGRVTVDQDIWLWALAAGGHECYIWRPSDWDDVVRILNGETG